MLRGKLPWKLSMDLLRCKNPWVFRIKCIAGIILATFRNQNCNRAPSPLSWSHKIMPPMNFLKWRLLCRKKVSKPNLFEKIATYLVLSQKLARYLVLSKIWLPKNSFFARFMRDVRQKMSEKFYKPLFLTIKDGCPKTIFAKFSKKTPLTLRERLKT